MTTIDEDGHGTHTTSTIGDAFVDNAEVLGNAKGKAAGIAPHAHLAIYKVCFGEDCPKSSVLAALDAAMEDGVNNELLLLYTQVFSRRVALSGTLTLRGSFTQVLGRQVDLAPVLECWNIELLLPLNSGVGMLNYSCSTQDDGGLGVFFTDTDLKRVLEARDDCGSTIGMDDGVGVVIIKDHSPTTTLHRRHACASVSCISWLIFLKI
ncbi:hypothetical protein LR48_Vigan01g105600 [Vigna angularis]|uniref:Peptidase S8/S53 domain-containing protein n=1 Tax=Phaseolus angularis TaxID=3914 RepID=A0A0L9TM20_PHAAN|nr:hypothetical protein LR48_Vigan01g105600 [Vigna angularis]